MIYKLVISIFILSSISMAEKIELNDSLPPFFRKLLQETYQNNKLSNKMLLEVNLDLKKINPKSLMYFDKELIKFILTRTKILKKGYKLIDQKMYDHSIKSLSKISSKRPFSRYIFNAFITDLAEMITDNELKTYKNHITKRLIKLDSKTKIFRNKVALLTPWLRILHDSSDSQLDNHLDKLSLDSLNHILGVIKLFKRTNRLSPQSSHSKLTFVKRIDKELEDAKELIDQLTFQISPSKEDSYAPPKDLPKAVDHWVPVDETVIEDGLPLTRDQLFPKPELNYTPPKMLPKPIDDWSL